MLASPTASRENKAMTYRLMVVAAANSALRNLPQQMGDEVAVQLFESADEALWELQEQPPEALVAEVDLPGKSGVELAEIITHFEVPTRVVLYHASEEEAAPLDDAVGVHHVLHGPLAPEELVAALQAALQAGAAMAEQPAGIEAQAATDVALPLSDPAPPAPAPADLEQSASEPEPVAPQESQESRPAITPARVVLPPLSERNAAPTPASPGRSSLAARSKAAAERAPARPAPAEGAAPSWRSGGGNLVVTEQNINAIRLVMSQLSQDLGTQSVMLTDRAGMVLVEVGSATNLPMMIVLPLLSTGFSTTGEVARQLREQDATSVYIHEGVNVDLYCFDVMQRFLLVLVFNKRVASSKIGAVWINAKRAIRELREAFTR
jgi:DNA-binding NarL/FixJ family response regulator